MAKLPVWSNCLRFLLALMDVIGGILGTFFSSLLALMLWHITGTEKDELKRMVISQMTATMAMAMPPPPNAGAWKTSLTAFNYKIVEFQYDYIENYGEKLLKRIALIFSIAVISALYFGILKVNDDLGRIPRLLFKCIARIANLLIVLIFVWEATYILIGGYHFLSYFAFAFVEDLMATTVLVCIFAVLSLGQLVFGVTLLLGICKGRDCYKKFWLKFKCIAVPLTFLISLRLIWVHATSKQPTPTKEVFFLFYYMVDFVIINGVFLAIIRKNLPKESVLKSMGEALQHLKLDDVIAPGGILERWAKFIEENGLQTEGLYRVPGNKAEVDRFFSTLAEDPNTDIQNLNVDVEIVATALKELVAKRISPVIPMDMIQDVERIALIGNVDALLQELKQFLSHLPSPNITALKILIQHLTKVAARCEVNSMNSKNLAICWWPILLPFVFTDVVKLGEMQPQLENLVATMIGQYADIFGGMDNTV